MKFGDGFGYQTAKFLPDDEFPVPPIKFHMQMEPRLKKLLILFQLLPRRKFRKLAFSIRAVRNNVDTFAATFLPNPQHPLHRRQSELKPRLRGGRTRQIAEFALLAHQLIFRARLIQ